MRLPLDLDRLLAGRVERQPRRHQRHSSRRRRVKMLIAGADVTMLCSVLLRRGIPTRRHRARTLSLAGGARIQLGCAIEGLSQPEKAPDPTAFERALYLHTLTTAARNYARGAWVRNRTWPVSANELTAL